MTMSGLSTLSLLLFAVVSAGGMEELSLSAPGAPPLSGDSCSRVQGMGVLIDVDGNPTAEYAVVNAYFADTGRVRYDEKMAEHATRPVVPADATMATMNFATGHCQAGTEAPPQMPPCTGTCSVDTTPLWDRLWPRAVVEFVACGPSGEQRRTYRRVDGVWSLQSLSFTAVDTCPPVPTPAD